MAIEPPPLAPRKRQSSASSREIGQRELNLVSDLVLRVAPDWSVELSGDVTADRSLVVMPHEADDRMGPTFVIRLATNGMRLDQVQWDQYTTLLQAANMRRVLNILRTRLSALANVAIPPNVVLH